jgi:hypothetical protein
VQFSFPSCHLLSGLIKFFVIWNISFILVDINEVPVTYF